MNIISYNIDFAQCGYKDTNAIFPFTMIYQTKSLIIEKYCIKSWPILMTYQQYTAQDNLNKFKMVKYIKDNLTASDKIDIHKMVYDKSWMTPLEWNDNNTKCDITEFGCKTWSNPNVPYLELKGIITVNLIDMLSVYIKKNWITFETNSSILSEGPYIKLNKSLPFIIRYNSSQTPFDIILKEVTTQANKSGSMIDKLLVNKTKLKNIHSYDKKISWGLDKTIINIELKEKIRLLKDKALTSPIKYGLLGLGIHHITKDWSTSSKVTAATAGYLYLKGKK